MIDDPCRRGYPNAKATPMSRLSFGRGGLVDFEGASGNDNEYIPAHDNDLGHDIDNWEDSVSNQPCLPNVPPRPCPPKVGDSAVQLRVEQDAATSKSTTSKALE